MDEELRRLERRAATGDPEAQARLDAERARAETLGWALARRWRRERDDLWRHDAGVFLSIDDSPRPLLRVGFDPPTVTLESTLLILGLDRALIARGARLVRDSGLDRGGGQRYYDFAPAERPEVDPSTIPAAEPAQTGWVQVTEGIWLHGPELASVFVNEFVDWEGNACATFSLTWVPEAEALMAPLCACVASAGLVGMPPAVEGGTARGLYAEWSASYVIGTRPELPLPGIGPSS